MLYRRWTFPLGSATGAVEREERRPQFPPHPRPGHRALPTLGQGGTQGCWWRLCGRAGRRAVGRLHRPRGRRRPTTGGLHIGMGGVQLQPRMWHAVVREREDSDRCLRRVQTLERLHAAPSHRNRRGQTLADPLSENHVPHGARVQLVLQPQPVLAVQSLSPLLPEV